MWLQRSVNLQYDMDQWDDDNNEIVKVAKEISNKLNDMAQFARNQGLQPAGSIKVLQNYSLHSTTLDLKPKLKLQN